MLDESNRPSLNNACKFVREKEGGFLYNYDKGEVKVVNKTGLHILEKCDGNSSIKKIMQEMGKEFPSVSKKKISKDVLEFLDKALEEGVLKV